MQRHLVSIVALALGALAGVVACEDLNRPMKTPQSEPRTSCFTDVECPSSGRCVKGPQDIQGICQPRASAPAAPPDSDPDAGGGAEDAAADAPAPAPTVTPQPGDIQI